MHTVETLLKKFWAGTSTPEENASLDRLLAAKEQQGHEEMIFFKSASGFTENTGDDVVSKIPDALEMAGPGASVNVTGWNRSEELLQKMHERIKYEGQPSAKIRSIKWSAIRWVAAATIIFLITGGYLFMQAPSASVNRGPDKQAEASQHVKQVSNTGSGSMDVHMLDGTMVKLSPHSKISYYEPFGRNGLRDISLVGMAYFKVAKDAAHPFTVYANGVATTAVGTAFTVNTQVNNRVTVMLFEGKVMVRYTNSSLAVNTVFLEPGQDYMLEKNSAQPVVGRFELNDRLTAKKERTTKGTHTELKPVVMDFNKDYLANVLDVISLRYKTNILYNRKEIEKLRFTGRFIFPSDSLPTVLSVICNMTEMHFEQSGDSVKISKLN